MARFTVRQNRRYRASIALGLVESLASNDMIAARLESAGFAEVLVAGSGRSRTVEARWSKPDATEDLPPQVVAVEELA